MAKTRYLQLSLTTMLEYNLESASDDAAFTGNNFHYIMTKLADGHYLLFSPCSYEVTGNYNKDGKWVASKLPSSSIMTVNTLNHTAVPMDAKDSEWFIFNDPDYVYNTLDNYNDLISADDKVKSYSEYCKNPYNDFGDSFVKGEIYNVDAPKWDNVKLYFSSGYDFSDIYGALMRLCVERNDGAYLDLCDFFYTKSSIYKFITYMTKPIIFGNVIYDKYLNVKVISPSTIYTSYELMNVLDIKANAPIKIMFSYVDEENASIENIVYKETNYNSSNSDIVLPNAACYFARTSTIKGTIPTENLNSDNLGVYIASSPNLPYVEFYGTWKDEPLTSAIVHSFNKSIMLYDATLIKKPSITYEVDDDYVVDYDMKKWIAHHEIQCDLITSSYEGPKVVNSEVYTQQQSFIGSEGEMKKFYYRPVIFNDSIISMITSGQIAMSVSYTLRLMNIEDGVQFIKTGALSFDSSEMQKFCAKTTNLNFSDRIPYKVYNKIIEQKQEVKNNAITTGINTKYVKTFYNMTDIVLDVNGNSVSSNNYTLTLSQAPRNYKFVFKQVDYNGNTHYMDLTDTYYKLYIHDASGSEVIIEPTYSSNMNLLLGELEFNISSSNLNILRSFAADSRHMSIIAYNSDNSTSSMFDMTYTF